VLKHPLARSKIEDLGDETQFRPYFVSVAEGKSLGQVDNVFLCTGKISYDIRTQLKADTELDKKSAVISIEELLPFPEERLKNELSQLKKSAKV
jgi:2-oxoglutarate dehydrogenase E1 component